MRRPTSSKDAAAPGAARETPDDRQLVEQARSGSVEAFDALLLRHQDRIFTMVTRMLRNREDARDVCQEVFLTAFRRLDAFRAEARFSTWLYRIAINRCRDELRRRGFRKYAKPQSLDGPAGIDPPAGDPPPAARMAAAETADQVRRAIESLPEELREVVLLREMEDLSYEEIASATSVPTGTVRSRLHRARELLRERLLPMLERES